MLRYFGTLSILVSGILGFGILGFGILGFGILGLGILGLGILSLGIFFATHLRKCQWNWKTTTKTTNFNFCVI